MTLPAERESSRGATAIGAVVERHDPDPLEMNAHSARSQRSRLKTPAFTASRPNSHRPNELSRTVFHYIVRTSWHHQLLLCLVTGIVFLLDVVPLELQRRVVNDLVKHRAFRLVISLGAVYAAVVVAQGAIKLGANVYRGWVGERAKRDLRRRIHAVTDVRAGPPAAEAEGIAVAMIVAEVESLGGFVGESIAEPLLQAGSLAAVLAYILHLDPWMGLAAFALFAPQFVFVPLLQRAINRRTGIRVRVVRQLGIDVIAPPADVTEEDRRIDRTFELDMGIFRLKFSMNFLMNLSNHFQIIAGLLLGGWWVLSGQLEVGAVVAFISGIGRLNDPWGDLVNYFRDANVAQVKFRLLADALARLG